MSNPEPAAAVEHQRLQSYRSKRDFARTPEPRGGRNRNNKKIFVVQKHNARVLHYDFRLSIGGVLKSWAVPKGVSTTANEKRLAIRTEDHPMDYAEFEGVIPKDQYGGGTVLVWDSGEYLPLSDGSPKQSMQRALQKGILKFELKGKKLKGGYVMVRTGKRQEKEQWLIFKLDDEHADAGRNPVSTEPDSVLSGRSLQDIARPAR